MTTLIASLVLFLALEATIRWLPKKYAYKHHRLIIKVKTLLKRWKLTFEVAEKLATMIKLLKVVGRLIISLVPMVMNWFDYM